MDGRHGQGSARRIHISAGRPSAFYTEAELEQNGARDYDVVVVISGQVFESSITLFPDRASGVMGVGGVNGSGGSSLERWCGKPLLDAMAHLSDEKQRRLREELLEAAVERERTGRCPGCNTALGSGPELVECLPPGPEKLPPAFL